MNPFLALTSEEIVTKRLTEIFPDIPESEVKEAAHKAWRKWLPYIRTLRKKVR